MDETEWLASTYPAAMLDFLGGKASKRKLRLFACACCRRIWHLFPSDICKQAVKYAELYADRLIGEEERREAARRASEAYVCAAAVTETALGGTWDPLDCLAAEHDRVEYEDLYERACEEARQMPSDGCEASVAREATQAVYYALVVDDLHLSCTCNHAESAMHFFY